MTCVGETARIIKLVRPMNSGRWTIPRELVRPPLGPGPLPGVEGSSGCPSRFFMIKGFGAQVSSLIMFFGSCCL